MFAKFHQPGTERQPLFQMKHLPLVMVEVINSTPEPDGTSKRYFLRTDPSCRTARQAIAWTWGMKAKEYCPEIET